MFYISEQCLAPEDGFGTIGFLPSKKILEIKYFKLSLGCVLRNKVSLNFSHIPDDLLTYPY